MDEILREVPGEPGGATGSSDRLKGPTELITHERHVTPADDCTPDGAPSRLPPPRQQAAADVGDAIPVDEIRAAALAEESEALLPDDDETDGEPGAGEDEAGLPPVPAIDDPAALARILYVLILTQRDGLTLFRLAQACNCTQKLVEQGLERLGADLQQSGLPLELARTGDSVRLLTLPEAFPYLQRLRGVKKMEKLSPAALETLAVIAYRQPVMRAEIEAIRGVKAGPMLRTLLQHKLVRITGRADVPGRPLQYGTTQQFLERFALSSLAELPSVKEFKQLG
jgi:segregation and condensation protein B